MYRQQVSKKTSPSLNSAPISNDIAPSPSYGSLSGVVQRVQEDPQSVSGEELQQLESAIGTRATGKILAGKQTSQEARFADPNSPMTDELLPDQILSSRVKDVRQVWIKDTIMNIGLGLLESAQWLHLKKRIKGGYWKGGIKRKLAKYKLPIFSYKTKTYQETVVPLNSKAIIGLITGALDQIVSGIDSNNLDEQGGRGYKIKKMVGIVKPRSFGLKERPELFGHDPSYIGARQDTYIPADKVQMPEIWGKKRLHVVESRKDTVERLRFIKKIYKTGGYPKISSLPMDGFDYSQLDEPLEEGAVALGNGYVLTAAQAEKLAGDKLENVNITPDGDCLFNSLIAVGAFNGDVGQFRKTIADAVKNGTVDVSGFMLNPDTTARDIRTIGSYNNLAGDSTPSIISQVLDIKIIIYNENGDTTPLVPHNGGAKGTYKVIRFTSPGAHYHATRDI